MFQRVDRRDIIASGLALGLLNCRPTAVHESRDPAQPKSHRALQAARDFAAIEARIGGRVGVFAFSPASDVIFAHRAQERFAMCSTFKWALAAAVLQRVDQGQLSLDQAVSFSEADLEQYAPVTRARLAEGQLSIRELAHASVTVSDNTAANLLLTQIGGPEGMTQFFRGHSDTKSRLDRYEPMLNMNTFGEQLDTTTPEAMARLLRNVLDGNSLSAASQKLVVDWMIAAETGLSRLRAGLPKGVRVGDKTGSCNHGAAGDVAFFWTAEDDLWFIASYLSESRQKMSVLNEAHAEIGRIVAAHVFP